MLRNLTFTSIFWIALGLISFSYGGYLGWTYKRMITYMFPFPFGLTFTGIAMILCGVTNGFTDHTPLGRKITKVGVLLFLAGFSFLGLGIWRNF